MEEKRPPGALNEVGLCFPCACVAFPFGSLALSGGKVDENLTFFLIEAYIYSYILSLSGVLKNDKRPR